MEAIIRRAKSADLPHLVDLLRDLFSIEADFEFDAGLQEQGLFMMLQLPETRCIMVAETDNNVVGMCTGQLVVSTAKGGFSGFVEDLVINQKYRRKGLGNRLLEAVEKWCINKGAQRIQLLADKNNTKALTFYEKCHWQKTQLICLRKTGDGP